MPHWIDDNADVRTLAKGSAFSQATAYRYHREALEKIAPNLTDALKRFDRNGEPLECLNENLIFTNKGVAPTQASNHLLYSDKHTTFGGYVQIRHRLHDEVPGVYRTAGTELDPRQRCGPDPYPTSPVQSRHSGATDTGGQCYIGIGRALNVPARPPAPTPTSGGATNRSPPCESPLREPTLNQSTPSPLDTSPSPTHSHSHHYRCSPGHPRLL